MAILVLVGLILWLVGLVIGGVVGHRIAKLIPTEMPEGLAPTGVSKFGWRVAMWLFRVFIFLIMVVVVTAPIGLVVALID